MKLFLFLSAIILASSIEVKSCGNFNPSNHQWPWAVSIFSNMSNMVLCQGAIISNKQILTAGHCLQHKSPSSLLVYSGSIFHRNMDDIKSLFDHQLLWQVEQINFHPDMKLTSRAKFINGGFVASMAIHADLAIATLKQEIQFKDMITSVCLPNDDSIENLKKIHGSYSGWNMNNKEIESFNVTVDTIGDAEIFEIADENENVELVAGTGFYVKMNSSWLLYGLLTEKNENSEDGSEHDKFINIHKFVEWIRANIVSSSPKNITTSVKSSSSPEYPSSTSSSRDGKSFEIQNSSSTESPSSAIQQVSSTVVSLISENPLSSTSINKQKIVSNSSTTGNVSVVTPSYTEKITIPSSPLSTSTSSNFEKSQSSSVTEKSSPEVSTQISESTSQSGSTPSYEKSSTSVTNENNVSKTSSTTSSTITSQVSTAENITSPSEIISSTEPTEKTSTVQNSTEGISIKSKSYSSTATTEVEHKPTEKPVDSASQIKSTTLTALTRQTANKTTESSTTSTTASISSTTIPLTAKSPSIHDYTSQVIISKHPQEASTISLMSSISSSETTSLPITSSRSMEATVSDTVTNEGITTSVETCSESTALEFDKIKDAIKDTAGKLVTFAVSSINEVSSTESSAKSASENSIKISTDASIVEEVTKKIASSLQSAVNSSLVPKIPQGRDLKDFGDNLTDAVGKLLTISSGLPSIISTTLSTSLDNSNTSTETTMMTTSMSENSTDSSGNSTLADAPVSLESAQGLLAGLGVSPALMITGIFGASMLIMFIIFGMLALQKPVSHKHEGHEEPPQFQLT